jgi:hypothetical protein
MPHGLVVQQFVTADINKRVIGWDADVVPFCHADECINLCLGEHHRYFCRFCKILSMVLALHMLKMCWYITSFGQCIFEQF